MREFDRPVAPALSVVGFAAAIAIAFAGDALAQANQAPPNQTAPAPQAAPPQPTVKPIKQMALTDKQIEGVLAAQKDMDAITEKLPENAKPDPKVTAQPPTGPPQNAFASTDTYNDRVRNNSMATEDFPRATKQHVQT